MAPLTIPEEVRAKAEVYTGDAAGQEKTRLLLQETGLPSGLLPLRDILECGYVEETGFVWLKQRRRVDHYFAGAGRHVSYGAEVSAVAEKGRLKKITGVKAKELLIWVSLHEICLDGDETAGKKAGSKLVCKALGGLSRSFPAEAFEAPPLHDTKPPTTGPAASAKQEEEEEANKLQEEVKKQQTEEEEKKQQGKKEGVDDDDKAKKEDGASSAAVDAVGEKLKDMTTTTTKEAVVRAEAVAAKN